MARETKICPGGCKSPGSSLEQYAFKGKPVKRIRYCDIRNLEQDTIP